MKGAVIYARVSTEQQEEQKTIESQLTELREICKRDGVKIVKEYIDDGWSGGTLARPSLDQLRDEAKKGIWEVLYVYSSDRLGRDHIDQGIVLRELKKEGIEVVFKDRALTDETELLTNVESLLAEYEKKQFLERTRRGKLYKVKSGKVIHCKPPYGYKFVVDKNGEWHLEINQKEAEIVKLVFNLYLQYQSTSRVTKELFERGIYTRANYVWRPIRISQMLKDETYIGNWHYNKNERVEPKVRYNKFYKRVKSSRRVRDKKEWLSIKVPAIIEKNLFETIQELLRKNFKLYGTTKYVFILSGLLRCAKCGSRMVGFCHRGKFFYYRCYQRQKKFPQPFTCRAGSVRMTEIDSAVWNTVKRAIQNPKVLIQYISYLKNDDRDSQALVEVRKELLRKKVQIKQNKIKLLDLYELDEIDKEVLLKRIGEHSQTEKAIDSEIREIELRLNQATNKSAMITKLEDFSKLTKSRLDNLTSRQIKDFLRTILKEITYNPDTREVNIIGYIPLIETSQKEWEELMELPIQTLLTSRSRSVPGLDEYIRFDILVKV